MGEENVKFDTDPASLTFLIVEDNLDMGAIMKRRVEKIVPGATVVWEKKALAAQRYLYKNNVNMIFLDLNLEDSFGIESVKEIKAYARAIPIVVMTGIAGEITIEETMKQGASELILKTNLSEASAALLIEKYTGYKSETASTEDD